MDQADLTTMKNYIWEKMEEIMQKRRKVEETFERIVAEEITNFRASLDELSGPRTGPLLLKTPKPRRKRIETILEDEIMSETSESPQDATSSAETVDDEVPAPRTRRGASLKASANIKKQQSMSLASKMRRPSTPEKLEAPKVRNNRVKRPKVSLSDSDTESPRPAKQSRLEIKVHPEKKIDKRVKPTIKIEPIASPPSMRSSRSRSAAKAAAFNNMTHTIVNESLAVQDVTVTDPSMYEDALGKPVPMNSTMNPNTTMTIDRKMFNVTVVLDKVDRTITQENNSTGSRRESAYSTRSSAASAAQSKTGLVRKVSSLKKVPGLEELMTDDESSPERRVSRSKRRRESSDEDDSPVRSRLPAPKIRKYKTPALFSPFKAESVKTRVAAFEQAQRSPEEVPMRLTRTKTRALAKEEGTPAKTAVKLARKSLAKAKKISLAKHRRDEEEKENTALSSAQKLREKIIPKARTTPVSKSRLQMPMSVNRIQRTPVNAQIVAGRPQTASRVHAGGSGESTKTLSSSMESLEKRREEDAQRKKQESLKAATEERRRRREEKELKNRLAREARVKLEQEKRLRLEREREEKAKQAQLQQERLREETEKKRHAQQLRAQEKEERRRAEEQAKLARLQEQEETERLLAEQKRREQEAERKRMAEARAQQLAAAENAKVAQQYQAKAKTMMKPPPAVPMSYKLDSDPDEDDASDNEMNPKHIIPPWAKPHVRRNQLEMQKYIPIATILHFFGAQTSTPDLSELFVGIKKDRLQRTSSAIWKPLPRFSMMED